jgi:hypothetical protein
VSFAGLSLKGGKYQSTNLPFVALIVYRLWPLWSTIYGALNLPSVANSVCRLIVRVEIPEFRVYEDFSIKDFSIIIGAQKTSSCLVSSPGFYPHPQCCVNICNQPRDGPFVLSPRHRAQPPQGLSLPRYALLTR